MAGNEIEIHVEKQTWDHTPEQEAILLNEIKIKPVKTFVYPLEMGEETFYPEAIKFTVCKRESASLEEVIKAAKESWAAFGKIAETGFALKQKDLKNKFNTSNQSAAEGQAIAQALNKNMEVQAATKALVDSESADGDTLRTIYNYLKDDTYFGESLAALGHIFEQVYKGLNPKHINETTYLAYVYLNMPNEITFAEPVAWEGMDLNSIGAFAKSTGSSIHAGAMANLGNMVGGGTGALAGLVGKHFSKIPGLGMMSGGILGMLGGDSIQRSLEASFGTIANPYKEMTFQGIGFREFAFNFVFRARNETEVQQIQNIIETFRRYSKPTYHKGSTFLNYPEEFWIEFLTKDEIPVGSPERLDAKGKGTGRIYTDRDRFKTNPYVPQLKMCVCKGVTTNFTSQNTWRALKTGHPVEISLQLQFEETELVTSEDVMGTAQVGRFTGKGKF